MACHLLGTLKGRGGVRVLTYSPYLLEYDHVYGNWWLAIGSDCWLITWCWTCLSIDRCSFYYSLEYILSAWTYFMWVQKLQSSFGEESLEAFGLLRSSRAIRAAGGLLGWALYAACSHPIYIVLHALVLSISFVPQYWFPMWIWAVHSDIIFEKFNRTVGVSIEQTFRKSYNLRIHVIACYAFVNLLMSPNPWRFQRNSFIHFKSTFWLILLVYSVFTSCLDVRLICKNMMSLNILNECMEFVSFSLLSHWSYCAFQHVCGRYVQETQKLVNEEIPLQKPSYYSIMDTMHMDDTVRSHLEVTSRLIFKQQS